RFDVSDIEVRRRGPSYTADTLAALAEGGDELFLILGADAVADLPNWVRPEEIVRQAWIAVAPREGMGEGAMENALRLVAGLAERLLTSPMLTVEISATELRERARNGESVRYFVPDAVDRYLRQKGLYRADHASLL
ncbi:MAG TPA: nicotinic acid mononucleotide adenylyltransferase, partial [Dehalococcoidia bacterium]|nr:nicotinic acid mononucleotide adenylyltransferase [Dehalococcoidia bacterium]